MPPRRAKSAASKSSKKATTKNAGSKEAKKLGLSAEDEASIREIFEQFGEEDEELGEIMQTSDLRQALKLLGFDIDRDEMKELRGTLDPEDEGFFAYSTFLELCALKMDHKDRDDEADRAYQLFAGEDGKPITVDRLRQLAKALKEDLTDEQLQDMISFAAGGKGYVDRDDFQSVMERAGAL